MEEQKLAVMTLPTIFMKKDFGSYIVTSGGDLLRYVNREKVKIIRLPVQSKTLTNNIKLNNIEFFNPNTEY